MNTMEQSRSPLLQVIAGGKTHSGKKDDRRSTELRFAQELAADHRYSQSGNVIYFWNGTYHEAIHYDDMQKRAFGWLEKNQPEHASSQKAKVCVDSALLKLNQLPCRDDGRVIIPLFNGYLEALADGRLQWLDPDAALGMTHVIDVSLPRSGVYYQPGLVPMNSFLDHYFSTSLPDQQVCDYLQEMAGDTLIPNIRFQRAALLKGEGRNGKSIFVRLMAALHHRVAYKRLDELHGFHLMDLVGASLAIADEVPRTGLNEQAFKAIVSGEKISVDIKYQNPVSVQMTAKWIICTNCDQRATDNTLGFWRRLVIIPFDHTIELKDVIPELDRKIIHGELAYFLDWCLLGLQRLLRRGDLAPLPPVLEAAKRQAIQASDPVQDWIVQCFVAVSGSPISKQKIYDHFYEWCLAQGYRQPPLATQFWKVVKAHFGEKISESQLRIGGKRMRCTNLSFE